MSQMVDNVIAYRILKMLVTDFKDTQAAKLGIIDDKGKQLKKIKDLKGSDEKNAYTYLHRLVFNMKRIINKWGGESKTKSLVAALWLIKEYYENGRRTTSLMESRYEEIYSWVDQGIVLVEEEIAVKKFEEEAPVNNTAGASVDTPAPKTKDVDKYKRKNQLSSFMKMTRRN
jgi:hypothetical protein